MKATRKITNFRVLQWRNIGAPVTMMPDGHYGTARCWSDRPITRASLLSILLPTGASSSDARRAKAMTLRIEDYALIGDCKTAALVGRDGSIDWLCWPRFDSAACFAGLLGTADNGRWLIAPEHPILDVSRRYRPGTLVLETEFQTEAGRAAVIDFMPPADGANLVRIVVGRSGRVAFRTELVVRFNYGAIVPWVNRLDDGAISAIAGPERLVLRTPVELYGEDLTTIGAFAVEAGQSIPFVLSYGASFQSPPPAVDGFDALARTEAFW